MNEGNRVYWFPAKRYGWGWRPPVTWQGWVVLIGWFVAFFAGSMWLRWHGYGLAPHLGWALAMCVLLVLVGYWKGESPRWRWGDRAR